MKALRPVIASNGILYIQMTLVGSHSTYVGVWDEKETMETMSIRLIRTSLLTVVHRAMGCGKKN
jgi:hypothetical protein